MSFLKNHTHQASANISDLAVKQGKSMDVLSIFFGGEEAAG